MSDFSVDGMSTSTAAREPRTSPASWTPLVLLSAGAFWTVTLELAPAGLLPELSADLDVPLSRVGWLVGVWALTIAVTSVPLARATRHLRAPLVLGAALGVVGAASLATALSTGFTAVLLGRLVSAAGHGLFWALLMAYAVDVAPSGREARAVSVVLAGPVLATLAGLPLATVLAAAVGWRVVVGGVTLALVAAGAALALLLPSPTASTGTGGSPAGAATPEGHVERWLLAATAAASLTLVGHMAVFTFVSPLLTGPGGLDPDDVGAALLVFGVAGALGLVLSSGPAERRPWTTVQVVTAGLGAVLLLLATAPQGFALWAAVAVWGLLFGAFPAAQQGAVVRAAPARFRATAGAVLVATFNGGIALGSVVGGDVLDRQGVTALPLVGGVLVLVSTAGTLLAVRGLRSAELRRTHPHP